MLDVSWLSQFLACMKQQVSSSPCSSPHSAPFMLIHPIHASFGEFTCIPKLLKGLIEVMVNDRVQCIF